VPGKSCDECFYLVGHAGWCSKWPKQDPETAGWNAGLEAAAKRLREARGNVGRHRAAALILTLKK